MNGDFLWPLPHLSNLNKNWDLSQRPLVDAAKIGEVAEISPASAYKLIVDFEQFGILNEVTGGKRGKQYLFDSYLQLFK